MAMEEEDSDLQPLTIEEILFLSNGVYRSFSSNDSTSECGSNSNKRPSSGSPGNTANLGTSNESIVGHVQARTWAGQVC